MDAKTTIFAAVAVGPNGSNVYLDGVNCEKCDRTYDPHNRTGVPCRDPRGHATVTVLNWRQNGRSAPGEYRVVGVIIVDQGDIVANIRAAREMAR